MFFTNYSKTMPISFIRSPQFSKPPVAIIVVIVIVSGGLSVGSASPKRAKSRRSGNIGLQKLIHGSNERYLYPDEKLAWYQT